MTDQEYEEMQKRVDAFIIWTVKLAVFCAAVYFGVWLFGGLR